MMRSETGKVRPGNEDNCCIFDVGTARIMAVADGIGGIEGGEIASKIAIDTVNEVLSASPVDTMDEEALKELLKKVYQEANIRILKYALSEQSYMGMGTTLTIAVIRSRRVIVAHMGDCRGYLIHGSSMTQMTADHTYAAELLRGRSITLEEYLCHPERHTLIKSLGENAFLIPDLYIYNIIYGDVVMLCTDGLCSFVDDETIRLSLKKHNDLADCLDNLFARAYEAGSDDNITVLLTHVTPEGKKE